jgi:signal transduction histidine kinase
MRRRVLISILLVIAATVLTLGVPLSIVSWRVVDDLMHSDLSSRLESIAASIANQSGSSEIDLGQLEAAVPAGGRLEIRMAGRIDQSIGAAPTDQVYSEQLAMAGGGLLRLSVPESYLRAEQWTALALVGLAVLLSVVVGTGVAVLTAGRLVTPMTDVARRAARLGSGDFRTFRRRYGIAELDRVADVLDSSAQDIAALIARERDLAGDISHQLRTRLTGLRLRLEELAEHPDPLVVEEVEEALEQTDRLVTVVDDLLANARSERAAGASEVVLGDELAEIEAEWRPRLVDAGRSLTVRCPRDAWVHATPGRLREAIGVLVENSLLHGAGAVGITVRSTGRSGESRGAGGMVVLEVSDEGPGVPEGLVAHVFDRGVSTASSTGIGLGLARAFIEADGGRLELRRAAPPIFAIFLAIGQPPAVVGPEGAPAAAATGPAESEPAAAGPSPTGGSPGGR